MFAIPYDTAAKLVAAVIIEGRRRSLAPLSAAVLDTGGHLVAFARDDGSSLLRPQIAIAKASSVLGMGFGGRELVRRAKAAPAFYGALAGVAGGEFLPALGGVLIRGPDNVLIGALGVTGDSGENDESCAIAAITAASLLADAGGD